MNQRVNQRLCSRNSNGVKKIKKINHREHREKKNSISLNPSCNSVNFFYVLNKNRRLFSECTEYKGASTQSPKL